MNLDTLVQRICNKTGQSIGRINAKFHTWFTPADDADNVVPTVTKTTSHHIDKCNICKSEDALVDRGADGFVGDSDCALIGKPADG